MEKKNKNMISRSMGEGALFSFVMLLVILYIMYTYGYLKPFESWEIGLRTAFTLILLPMGFGIGFGFYQSFRMKLYAVYARPR